MLLTSTPQIIDKLSNFDWYVALSRGGLPVAGFLAYITGVKQIDTLNIWSYEDHIQGKFNFIEKDFSFLQDKKVLIIDDLVDTGATMQQAIEHIKNFNPELLETFVAIKKSASQYNPTYYLKNAPHDDWVHFRWDLKDKFLLDLLLK
jgi:uncharacterized protein